MRTDQSTIIDHSVSDMPLITPSTFVQTEEPPMQPQALPSESNYPLQQHGESVDPLASVRNEANRTGAKNHSRKVRSRSEQQTMSSVEELMLQLKSWHNFFSYSDMSVEYSKVQKCIRSYCGGLWTDFSNLVGLSLSSSTHADCSSSYRS